MSGGAHKFCSTAPVQDPPSPPPSDFLLAPPLSGDEGRAKVRRERRCGGIFPTAGRAGGGSRRSGGHGEAVAFQRAGRIEMCTACSVASGLSRTESGRDPQFCSTAPVQDPPPLPPPSDFDLGPPLCGGLQSRGAMGAAVRRNFSNCRRWAGGGSRRSRGHGEAVAFERAGPNEIGAQCAALQSAPSSTVIREGPPISVRPPPCRIPVPSSIRFRFGPATLWRPVQSRGAMGGADAAEFFQRSAVGRSGEVEEAAVTEKLWPSSERARMKLVHSVQRCSRPRAQPTSGRGPQFCSTAPVQDPRPLLHPISIWAGLMYCSRSVWWHSAAAISIRSVDSNQ